MRVLSFLRANWPLIIGAFGILSTYFDTRQRIAALETNRESVAAQLARTESKIDAQTILINDKFTRIYQEVSWMRAKFGLPPPP